MQILAGNARKVGSVRFERLNTAEKSLPKEQGGKTSWQQWEERESSEYEAVDMGDNVNDQWDSESEYNGGSRDHENNCNIDDNVAFPKNRYLIADSIDVDSLSDSDIICYAHEDLDSTISTEKNNCILESDAVDISTATAVDTLYNKWEKHKGSAEKQGQHRKKPPFEPTVKLDSQGKFEHDRHRKLYLRRKETDKGIKIVRKSDSDV